LKSSPELAQALTNLRPNHDFEVVLEAFARARQEARDTCESSLDDTLRSRAQGEALFLKEFLKLNEAAPTDLDKFKRNKL
jgi:hypothetical protein